MNAGRPGLPDHYRARHALAVVEHPPGNAKALRQSARAMPGMVATLGLGQAVATAMAARGSAWDGVLAALESWLCVDCSWSPYHGAAGGTESATEPRPGARLLKAVVEGDLRRTIRGTTEALAYLGWLKKLSSGLLADQQVPEGKSGVSEVEKPS